MLIIIVLLMRKYYTLVKNGAQEGVGAGNQEVSVLQPAWKSDDAKDFLCNSRNFIHLLLSSPLPLKELYTKSDHH